MNVVKEYRLEAKFKHNSLIKKVICTYLKYTRLSFEVLPCSEDEKGFYLIVVHIPYDGANTTTLIHCIESLTYYAVNPTEKESFTTESGEVVSQPKSYLDSFSYSLQDNSSISPSA